MLLISICLRTQHNIPPSVAVLTKNANHSYLHCIVTVDEKWVLHVVKKWKILVIQKWETSANIRTRTHACFAPGGIWKVSSYWNVERHSLQTFIVSNFIGIKLKVSFLVKQKKCYSPARQWQETLCKTNLKKRKALGWSFFHILHIQYLQICISFDHLKISYVVEHSETKKFEITGGVT